MRSSSILLSICVVFSAVYGQVTLGGKTVQKDKIVVYFFIGHSNMSGRGEPDSYFSTTHDRVWDFSTGSWKLLKNPVSSEGKYGGPAIPFLKKMAEKKPDTYFGAIHVSASGATIYKGTDATSQFRPDLGKLFAMAKARAGALKGKVTFGGVVTYLGYMESSDTDPVKQPERKYAESFAKDMNAVLTALRSQVVVANLPMVITELETRPAGKPVYWDIVNSQVNSLASSSGRVAVIESSDIPHRRKDDGTYDHHFSPEGQKIWAGRAVDAILSKGWFPVTATAAVPRAVPGAKKLGPEPGFILSQFKPAELPDRTYSLQGRVLGPSYGVATHSMVHPASE